MRGALVICLVVVLLIIGFLVVKNMGVDNPSGVTETSAGKYIEQAESTAANATERIKDIGDQVQGSE